MTLQMTGNNMNGSPELSLSGGNCSIFAWSPFGGGATRTGTATSLPGFNGERQDPLSGVTHLGNGYRAYSPALRRFTCPDSESPFGDGGINPYVYCEHDPVNNTDPSGHMPKKVWTQEEKNNVHLVAFKPAHNEQANALHVAQKEPIQGPDGATGNPPGQAEQRGKPNPPVPPVHKERIHKQFARPPVIKIQAGSLSGKVNPKPSLAQPAPPAMLKNKAIEDAKKIKKGVFVNYQETRRDFRIRIRESKLYYQGAPLTTDRNGEFKFIQDTSGKLYGVEANSKGIKHSSILGKEWPVSAGEMVVQEGILISMSNSSGHFYPGEKNLRYTEFCLKSVGVNGVKINVIPTTEMPKRLKETVPQYKAKYVNFK